MSTEIEEFKQGLSVASDSTNQLILKGGRGTTTLHSSWLHKLCSVCKHTFRLDDEIFISDESTVCHNTALLPCSGQQKTRHPQTESTTDFFKGLDVIWPPPKDLPIRRLETNDRLLAPPRAGFQRRKCAVCGHTLRLHDVVVICPCQPQKPLCEVAIHRDPAHNLYCWEAWKPDIYTLYCPATSRKING